MQEQFWLEKWQKGETAFHQEAVHAHLARFWPEMKLAARAPVFVPLCGKSRDMVWLKERGHPVTGVELSDIAVHDFFTENGLAAQRSRQGVFDVSEAEGFRLYCGDFFAMTAEHVKGVAAAYDRAALIALPADMRKRYAEHMAALLPSGVPMLLVTLDYPEGEMAGPPFSVPPAEVERLYGDSFAIHLLAREDLADDRLCQRGLTSLHENAYLLTRK